MSTIAEPTHEAINEAARVLGAGGVIAFPTETVYGLGADTFNVAALNRVYALKGRPSDNPLIAHVADAEQAQSVTADWDTRCQVLAERFWPGPLTLVLTKSPNVPSEATAGRPTIAVRSPAHPVARELLSQFEGAISAPSANRSGHVSATTAAHVAADFKDVPDLQILDGGSCQLGIESTVLDLTQNPPAILRPGSVGSKAIAAVLGSEVRVLDPMRQSASPGTALSHYAPNTQVVLGTRQELLELAAAMNQRAIVIAINLDKVDPPHELIHMPASAQEYASQLYSALRLADSMEGCRILIELPADDSPVWEAVRNRLKRAAS